jgi:hypothetical protein
MVTKKKETSGTDVKKVEMKKEAPRRSVSKSSPITIIKRERTNRDIGLEILSRSYMGEADIELIKRRALRYENRQIGDEEAVLAILTELIRGAEDHQLKAKLIEAVAEYQSVLGMDPRPVLGEMHRTELGIYKDLGFERVSIVCKKDACPACKKNDGVVITIEDALEKMPLPHKNCTRLSQPKASPYCRCRYFGEYAR